ncbi:cysteine-rich and transmembrane domain-containing protein WIH2-like [Olea europaea var. sylvestris]|uniref:cysteine-rich and transmembrane domain-containing protein WIH2-like n=1 Tax=Olea europaea var. sylvestris TaxID=158386 RepID=UPI000C1D8A4E|nr:cysteine-rich and transmembrane domain-containing protein WIH2-like [Olea europaea var. sylvestris]
MTKKYFLFSSSPSIATFQAKKILVGSGWGEREHKFLSLKFISSKSRNLNSLRNPDSILGNHELLQLESTPVGVPPPQGYPPEGYSKDAYPPPGYPPQGYPPQVYPPQGYLPQYAALPLPQNKSNSSAKFMEGCLVALHCCSLLDACF